LSVREVGRIIGRGGHRNTFPVILNSV
jgi:hypothetical protein